MATCYHTKKYDLFKFENNRVIYPNHVDEIAANKEFPNSFEFHPAVVNKDFLVIDGQHRIKAAQKLGIPVWYLIQSEANEAHIKSCNINQKPWVFKDFMEFYCNSKNSSPYLFIKNLSENYKISLHNIISICQSYSTKTRSIEFNKAFKNGMLELKNQDKIKDFIHLYDELINRMTKEKGVASIFYLKTKHYCVALLDLYKNNPDKFKVIVRKIPEYWMKMSTVGSKEQALSVLESIRFARNKI